MKNIFYLILFISFITGFGQEKYQDEKALLSENITHVSFYFEKNNLKIKTIYKTVKEILNESGQAYADKEIHYTDHWDKVASVTPYILRPKGGGKFKKIKLDESAVETKSATSGSVFYDDSKLKKITFPKLFTHDKAIVEYTELTNDPRFVSNFFFSSYIPTLKNEFKVSVPIGSELQYKLFNCENIEVKFTKETTNKAIIYTWKTGNVDSYEYFGDAPNIRYYEPHIVIHLAYYTLKGKKMQVLSSTDDLYNWYSGLVKKIKTNDSPELKSITDSIVAPLKTDEEKVKRIFYWVQDHIKYVAFEDGLGGFVPRGAANVCDKRYGDCKDMANLLKQMINYAGIDAYLTWVGSRAIPYSYHDVPTPACDNHMIASVNINGKQVFLDATSSYVKFGNPTGFIQGKETMVALSDKEFKIIKIPVLSKEDNATTETLYIKWDGNKIVGEGTNQFKGITKVNLTHALLDKSRKVRKKKLHHILEKGSNKFLLNNFLITGIDNRDDDIYVKYNFSIDSYAKKVREKLYLNPHFDKFLNNELIDIKYREGVPMEFDYKTLLDATTTLELPKEYKLSNRLEGSSYKGESFGFELSYEHLSDKIIIHQKVYINTLLLKKEQFEEWNNFIKKLNKAYKQTLVFNKK